jgi:hypothetical protein
MAGSFYTVARHLILTEIAELSGLDLRAMLLMSNTTALPDNTVAYDLGDYTTLDECDSTGYSRQVVTGAEAIQNFEDEVCEFFLNDLVFSGMSGDASRNIIGVCVHTHNAIPGNEVPIWFTEFAVPVTKFVTQLTVEWDAGIGFILS